MRTPQEERKGWAGVRDAHGVWLEGGVSAGLAGAGAEMSEWSVTQDWLVTADAGRMRVNRWPRRRA